MIDKNIEKLRQKLNSTVSDGLSRRTYLRTAIGVAGLSYASQSATAANYDTIKIQSGEHRDITVGSGETFANKLIDITADGATFRIEATGSNWEIRNIGVKGVYDIISDGHRQGISCRVDAGSTGIIDNYYFADGAVDDTYPGVTGIYVQSPHAGKLHIDNINIQDMPNNAIYASTPGYPADNPYGVPAGGQGAVEITNSYAANCKASHFRIGTTGSVIKNCVAVGGDRGVWTKFNDTRVVDSDLSGGASNRGDGDLVCGTNGWPTGTEATVTVEDTVYETTGQDIRYAGTIVGGSASRTPRTNPPSGVPLSAEEAASGSGSSGSMNDTTDSTFGSSVTFRIETANGAPSMSYGFTIDGDIVSGTGIESNDTWSSTDGQTTATGSVGNGYADAFEVTGNLVDWQADIASDQYTLIFNGQEIDPISASAPKTLSVESTANAPLVEYEFSVDGTVTKGPNAEDQGSIAQDILTDSGTQTQVTGTTGRGFTDDYEFEGTLLSWDANVDSSNYRLLLDGNEVDPAQF